MTALRSETGRNREIEGLLDIGRRAPSVRPGLAAGYLPSFESVVAVTSNSAAVMTTVGAYESARFSCNADPQGRGLQVRFNHDAIVEATISLVDHAARMPPAIQFRDRHGGIGHTAYPTGAADMLAVECLALSSTAPDPMPEEPPAAFAAFPGRRKAHREVDRQVIPHLLAYLAALRLPLKIALSNEGCIHCDDGALDDVSKAGDLMFLRMERTTLSFDPLLIGRWQIRPSEAAKDRPVLEALCPKNRRLFYLADAPRDCGNVAATWRVVLDSLPP